MSADSLKVPEFSVSYAPSAVLSGDVTITAAYDSTTPANGGLGMVARAIRTGTGGNLKVRYAGSQVDTILDLVAGETVQGQFAFIYATGTTAYKLTVFA